jgi:hypothetical protein
MPDRIPVRILKDGTIKLETPSIADENHVSAEQFMQALARYMGGEVTAEAKHEHSHGHVHSHEHGHSHH